MNQSKTLHYFNKKPLAAAMTVILAATVSTSALAVESNENESKTAAKTIMEVIAVHGTKATAAQSAQQVPAQVVALGAEQLEARQIVNIEDMSFTTPNVSLDGIGTVPGVANFSIRGLGINSSIPSIDPHVGVFIDGIYTGITYGVITDTFDLESIETYKGPQGVLFGRNVTGGAVLLRSARPTGDNAAKFKVGYEENQLTVAGAVEGALSDNLAGKVSLYQKDDKGSFYNSTLDQEVGKNKSQTARATLVYDASKSTQHTFIFEHGSIKGHSSISQDKNSGGTKLSGGSDSFVSAADEPGHADITWDQVTFESKFDLGTGRVTNIMGYRAVDSNSLSDIDSQANIGYHVEIDIDQSQFSNELRYNVSPSDNWDLTAGLFYFSQKFDNYNVRMHAGGRVNRLSNGTQKQSTIGVFVNNDYHISENLTINAGLRYTKEEKDVEIYPIETVQGGKTSHCDFDTKVCTGMPEINNSENNLSPKIGFVWKNDDDNDILVYGHWARAYRSGMFNFRTPVVPEATDVEQHDSFELGIKSTSADERLRINAAIFRNDISDMVRETNVPDDSNNAIRQDFVNTADATIDGIELDAMYLVSDQFVLTAAVGYLDGQYQKVLNDLNGDGEINDKDLDLKIPRLAKITYNLGFIYDIQISDQGSLATRVNYSYRDEAAYNDSNTSIFKALKMVDAGLTYTPNEGEWSLALYGKNLTNTVVLGGITGLPPSLGGGYYAPLKKGRRYGVEFNYKF